MMKSRDDSAVPHLVTVLVVVHAGQRAVWIAVDVRVHATGVTVAGPPNITLCTHTPAAVERVTWY